MAGRRATRASRPGLASVMLGQNRQAMRVVFLFEPRGRGRSFAFQVIAARDGLAAPPFGKISIVALRAGMHRRRVDGADETLRQLALGRRTPGFHDDLTGNVAPVKY